MARKEWIAMLLAGGQGSRLGMLTRNIAKPAVPFAGKYRIIDFSLSNCTYSAIDTVGVLTQYKPLLLHSYIGIGSAWDLNLEGGGLYILPPYVGEKGGIWYKGTANAVYQNIDFIEYFDPRFVLIISGDHIYKMDYSLMLEYHKDKNAEATIAVIEVPWEEASRFGIMICGENGAVLDFAEKPKKPRSNLASMGVYIFNWDILKEYLFLDEEDPLSENDFGKNVIPRLLKDKRKVYAYPFKGYWKDVGTIESYYTANMDLLKPLPEMDLFDDTIKIYSKPSVLPPHYIGSGGGVKNSLVPDGCVILGQVERSVLFPGVYVGEGSYVKDSILLPNVKIERESIIWRSIIGENTTIGSRVKVGLKSDKYFNQEALTVLGDGIIVPDGVEIEQGASIKSWQREEAKIS
ncbi:MAG: glgC 2 [Peptococcaceae bacterium]|jgi:glucose-1-phosphate adenylyltransferase|nr:glgC 2 [Peptococcaceae bacterium]